MQAVPATRIVRTFTLAGTASPSISQSRVHLRANAQVHAPRVPHAAAGASSAGSPIRYLSGCGVIRR